MALAVLAKRFSKSGECKPKVAELVHMTRLSERTVRSAVGTLAAKNVLRVVRTGQANEYEFIEADVAESHHAVADNHCHTGVRTANLAIGRRDGGKNVIGFQRVMTEVIQLAGEDIEQDF